VRGWKAATGSIGIYIVGAGRHFDQRRAFVGAVSEPLKYLGSDDDASDAEQGAAGVRGKPRYPLRKIGARDGSRTHDIQIHNLKRCRSV
jgi:hypothetical protein